MHRLMSVYSGMTRVWLASGAYLYGHVHCHPCIVAENSTGATVPHVAKQYVHICTSMTNEVYPSADLSPSCKTRAFEGGRPCVGTAWVNKDE